MKWTHRAETEKSNEVYDAIRARVTKTLDGWEAMVWPKDPAHGTRLGDVYSTASAAKSACRVALERAGVCVDA